MVRAEICLTVLLPCDGVAVRDGDERQDQELPHAHVDRECVDPTLPRPRTTGVVAPYQEPPPPPPPPPPDDPLPLLPLVSALALVMEVLRLCPKEAFSGLKVL